MSIPRAYLLANTKSGKGEGSDIPELAQKLCDEYGIQLINASAANSKEEFEADIKKAVASAKDDGGVVIAAGGDGTVRSVAQFALEAQVRFAAVPIGTFNFFARTHQIPENHEDALRLALTGQVKPVQVGVFNDLVFLNNASLGIYARSIKDREERTKIWGRNRMVVSISTGLSLFSRQKLLRADFETPQGAAHFDTPMIFLCNNDLQLEALSLPLNLCTEKGQLALVLMKPVTKLSIARILIRTFTGKLGEDQDLDSYCVKNLTISTARKSQDVALDAELYHLTSPFKVEVSAQKLQLICKERG
jgi:diacylglycerol kinase family enzyme